MHTLKDVEKAYSYYGKLPFFYNFFSYFFMNNLRKKAIAKLGIKPNENVNVLEIACGTGNNFKYIKQSTGKQGKITAIDYSEDMLKQAKKRIKNKNYKNINLIQADAAKIPLPKNHFDAVISTLGFSSIPNHKAALKIAVNSLKKGRKLVILDGKKFNIKQLNLLLPIFRWSKSWDKNKDLIGDIKTLFPKKQITLNQFNLGSNFILELKK